MDGKPSKLAWYGELPSRLLAAAVVRAVFLAFLPLGVWLFARRFKDARSRDQRLPTRSAVGAMVVFSAVSILRQPNWAKIPQRVDLDQESAAADVGL